MSDLGLRMESEPRSRRRGKDDGSRGGRRGGRGRKKKNRSGCAVSLALVVVLSILGGGGYWAYGFLKDRFGPPPDYSGSGSGSLVVEIKPGWATPQMANELKRVGVTKSVEAFTKVAREDKDQRASKIQPGAYTMAKHMSAKSAFEILVNPKNKQDFILRPGMRSAQVFESLAKTLKVPKEKVEAAAKDPSLGLPDYAGGNIEGFLFPASYIAAPGMDPLVVLKEMVARAVKEYDKDGLAAKAQAMGKKPYDVIIIASLVEAEGKTTDDKGKVAQVIYNRLGKNMSLGLDSTVNYYLGKSNIQLTNKELNDASNPYNTRVKKGLPPGPIGSPSKAAIDAALAPPAGKYLYFVTVDPIAGTTKFTDKDSEFQDFKAELAKWIKEHPTS
ncbi:endolytic transglycosylase MltG [Embleya hyalina]|uniref:Endolytic murein transglycosylase n=1 Tax=Embleya hyalina TaxID=516124 RepID=A0A401Z4J5_9ACTN|nr:endolytic transglycosylase MltG [Embleya hyalina]GCE01763.1 membrane protein [Embleya hyalina]